MMVKTRWHIAFLFLWVCLSACTQGVVETRHGTSLQTTMPSSALSSIDSLLWLQPDSALTCLLPYFDTCCRDAKFCVSTSTEYDRHYAHLLLSELLYKNDYAQTNRAELLDAVAYFDSIMVLADTRGVSLQGSRRRDARRASAHNIAFLDARAHYINGVGYYEHDSAVPACEEYLKALEVMEDHFEEKELVGKKAKFRELTYIRLSGLYSGFYLHEQTISCARQSLLYLQQHDSTSWYLAWVLNKIANQYEMIREFDSANYYYNRAISTVHDTTLLLYRDIVSHKTMVEYKIDNRKANTSLLRLSHLLSASENEKESLARCSYIGEILFYEQQYDSAWKYLNTVFLGETSIGFRKQAAEWLVEICKIQRRTDEIIEYADFLVPFANKEENQSEIKSQLAELYNEFVQDQLERQHKQVIRKHIKWSLIVFSGMSLVIIFIIVLYYKNKQKKQRLENHIDEVKQAHEMEQKALSGRLKKSNEALRELKNQIKLKNGHSSTTVEKKAATFIDEPICRLILERVKEGQFKSQMNCVIYKDYALNKEQIVVLRNAANRHFNHFTERLAQAYPSLTNSDLDYCCLYLLGLTDADIAALMQRAYNTINERSSKLKRTFGCESMLSVALQVIANENATI